MSTFSYDKTVTVTTEDGSEVDFDVTLDFDYSPAERGSRERGTGLQIEPDYPADCDLVSAKTSYGLCIMHLLSDVQIEQLEIDAVEAAEEPPEPDYEPDYERDYDDYIGPY